MPPRTHDETWKILVDAPAEDVEAALEDGLAPSETKKLFVDRIRDPADAALGMRRGIENQDARISAVQLVDPTADAGERRRTLVTALSALTARLGADRVFAPRSLADTDGP